MTDNLTDLTHYRQKKAQPDIQAEHNEHTVYPDRIVSARILSQFTLEQTSTLTGVPVADLEMIESGLLTPDITQLQSLSLGLGFPMEWFYKPPTPGWPDIEHTSLKWH